MISPLAEAIPITPDAAAETVPDSIGPGKERASQTEDKMA
jgi:hypothetical protein